MTHAARWVRVNELFHQALAEPPDRRAAFVEAACGGDGALRDELTSLLAAHDDAADFIERPATADRDRALVGHTIGHYRIERVLGQGGMGVVFLAEDLTLGRRVALKAVAPQFTKDAGRRERLRREARAAAALNHPGVATVYALEEIDGHVFIAGEYVPGHTLREELTGGPLPASRVIETGLHLSRALAAAHDRNIVHRDLKPENVIRLPTGEVKILDFGLARAPVTDRSVQALTIEGSAIGTPAYMSPEQIRGDAVDFRSDLFSLGVLLYELSTGVPPFRGSDPASTIARILESDPPELTDRVPASLAADRGLADLKRIIAMCLRKAPDARYASTLALVSALERAQAGRAGSQVEVRPVSASELSSHQGTAPPRWWWQFHQAMASLGYLVMLVPLWLARSWIGPPTGVWLFFAGLVGAVGASTLRLHLWFTVREYPSQLAAQRQRTGGWIRLADILFVAVMLAAAGLTMSSQAEAAALFVAAAVGALVAFAVIEPATTRAATLD